jgi:uncharacterized repeat protein (TIGR02543 family)
VAVDEEKVVDLAIPAGVVVGGVNNITYASFRSYHYPYVDNLGVTNLDPQLDSISLAGANVISLGDSVKYTATLYPEGYEPATVTYSLVKNDGTVSLRVVDGLNCYLKAEGNGTDTLVVSAAGKELRHTIDVAGVLVKTITLDGTGVKTIYSSGPSIVQLTATVTPANPTNPPVWSIDSTSIATIDQTGKLSLTGTPGACTVTLAANDIGGISASYSFKVVTASVSGGYFNYTGYDYVDLFNDGADFINGTMMTSSSDPSHSARGATWDYDVTGRWLNIALANSNLGRRQYYYLGKLVNFSEKLLMEFDFYPSAAPTGGATDNLMEVQTTFTDNAFQDVFTIYQTVGVTDSFHLVSGPVYSEEITRTMLSGTNFGGTTADNTFATRRGANTEAARRRAVVLPLAVWYHFKVTVDIAAKKLGIIITSASGTGTELSAFDMPLPDDFVLIDGIRRILNAAASTGSNGATYQQRIDNIGFKNLDVPSASVTVNAIKVVHLTQAGVPELMKGSKPAAGDVVSLPLPEQLPSLSAGSVLVGQTSQLRAIPAPLNAGNKNVTWTSLDPTLATVDATGLVKGVAMGTVTIRVTATDAGGYYEDVPIQVIDQPITGFAFTGAAGYYRSQAQIDGGVFSTIMANLSPDKLVDTRVTWSTGSAGVFAIVKSDSASVTGDSAYATIKILKTGRDTLIVTGVNTFRNGASYSANFYIDVQLNPYAGYDYVELFNNPSALNGYVENFHAAPTSIEAKDALTPDDFVYKYTPATNNAARSGRFVMGLARQVSWTKKAIIEFDWYADTLQSGASGPEGVMSFMNMTQDTTDWTRTTATDAIPGKWGVDTSAREIFTFYKTSDNTGFGVAVGPTYSTDSLSRTYNRFEARDLRTTKAQNRIWVPGQPETWYHVKVSVLVDKHIRFNLTSAVDTFDFAMPYPKGTPSAMGQIVWSGKSGHTWEAAVDALGIRNADADPVVPATSVSITNLYTGNYSVVPEGGTIGLSAVIFPYDVSDHNLTWSTSNANATATSAAAPATKWTGDIFGVTPGTVDAIVTVDSTPAVTDNFPLTVSRVYLDTIDIVIGTNVTSGTVRVNNSILAVKRYVGPANAGSKKVVWSISDPTKAGLEPSIGGDSCTIHGLNAGPNELDTIYLIATAEDGGGVVDTLTIFIEYAHISRIDIYGAQRQFYTSKPDTVPSFKVTPVINPTTASDTLITKYESTDPSILTVDQQGNVTLVGGYGNAAVKITARDTCLYPSLHDEGAVGNKLGYYYVEVAAEKPYAYFTDLEKDTVVGTYLIDPNVDTVFTLTASSGALQQFYFPTDPFQGTKALYTNLNGSGARNANIQARTALTGGTDTVINFRTDLFVGSPPEVNFTSANRNNVWIQLRSSAALPILTINWWRNTADATRRFRYFTEGTISWLSDSTVSGNTDPKWLLPESAVWLPTLTTLDVWYTLDVSIDNTQHTVSFTLFERDKPENTATVRGIPLPDATNIYDLKTLYIEANRTGQGGNGTNAGSIHALDNIGYRYIKAVYRDLSLNLDGGTMPGTYSSTMRVVEGVTYDEYVPDDAEMRRTGYTFHGWKHADGTDYQNSDIVGAADITLTAQWTIDCYTVHFTGATISLPDTCVNYGTRVVKPVLPARECYLDDDEGHADIVWRNAADNLQWNFSNTLNPDDHAAGLTLFADWGDPIVGCGITAGVNSVTVTPSRPSVQKGFTQQFSAVVEVVGTAATTVTWTVNGAAGTTISADGLLTIDAAETAAQLTVTATSTFDPSKSGTATVVVTDAPVTDEVLSVTVTPATATVAKGATQQFAAAVGVQGNAATTVTWSVSVTKSTITTAGLLTVATDETATSITVTATSTADPTKSGTATVTVPASSNTPVLADAYTALTVYPNPTSHLLTVVNDKAKAGDRIEVLSITGVLVKTYLSTGPATTIDLSSLPAGTYLVKLGAAVAKVVKQ